MSIITATQLQHEQLRDAAAVVDTLSQELSQGTRRYSADWYVDVDTAMVELAGVLSDIFDLPGVSGTGSVRDAPRYMIEALRDTSRRTHTGVQTFAQGDRPRFQPDYLAALSTTCLACYDAIQDIRGLFSVRWSGLPVYKDVAGTQEATWGDPVALIKDVSNNGPDFTQATAAARPILGRVPKGGRRNEAPASEGTIWTTNYATITQDGENPYGVKPSTRVVTTENRGGSGVYRLNLLGRTLTAGAEITVSVRLKPVSLSSPLRFVLEGTAFSELPVALVDFASRTVSPVSSVASWRLSEGVDGFFVVEATATTPADGVITLGVFNPTADTSSNEFLITALQVEFSDAATPYQAVISAADITEVGVQDVPYLRFDDIDDIVSAELPAIADGTLVLAGTEGFWIHDSYNFAGGTFDIGPTSYPGGMNGVLAAVGEPLVGGLLVVNRQLSQQERERVAKEMLALGSPYQIG